MKKLDKCYVCGEFKELDMYNTCKSCNYEFALRNPLPVKHEASSKVYKIFLIFLLLFMMISIVAMISIDLNLYPPLKNCIGRYNNQSQSKQMTGVQKDKNWLSDFLLVHVILNPSLK